MILQLQSDKYLFCDVCLLCLMTKHCHVTFWIFDVTVCKKDKEISDVKNVNSLYRLSFPQTLENWPLVWNKLYLSLKFSHFWRKNISHQVNVCDSSLSWSSCTFFVPWFKISKKLLVEKVFLKEKFCFKLFLSIVIKTGYL